MSLRTTVFLVIAAAIVGVIVYINPFKKDEEDEPDPPWFYQVSMDDITTIQVKHQDKQVKFIKGPEDAWLFEDPEGIPPSHERWGGIPLLLSGPQTRRNLTEQPQLIENIDLADYGLDEPQTIVDLDMVGNRHLQFRLGDKTTDGGHHYAQVVGFPQLFTIAASWGDVVARLAAEPPLPKWYVKRTPEEIVELNIYLGDYTSENTELLQFKKDSDNNTWSVQHFDADQQAYPVDPNRMDELVSLLSGPPTITVADPKAEDKDFAQYGIVKESSAIELRFAGQTERGTRFIDGILFTLGTKAPEKNGYYARSESDEFFKPVLLLDATWTEKVLALKDNIPYAPESRASAGSQPQP